MTRANRYSPEVQMICNRFPNRSVSSPAVKSISAVFIVWVVVMPLSSCTPPDLNDFVYGDPVPSFRFLVTLPQPVSKEDMHHRFVQLAAEQGFPNQYPGQASSENFSSDGLYVGFDFHDADPTEPGPRLHLVLESEDRYRTRKAYIIYYDDSMEPFDANDWQTFDRWHKKILPEIFTTGTIEVTTHAGRSVKFTDPVQVSEISASTGISVPE